MTPKNRIAGLCLGALSLLGAGQISAFQSTPSQNGAAQNAPASGPSLGEVARKTRNERQVREQSGDAPSGDAMRLARQLEDDQTENANTPPGLKYYRTKEYRLLVPWPNEPESRDQLGTMFSGSVLSGTKAVVLIGEPVPLEGRPAGVAALRNVGEDWISELGSGNRGGIEQKIGKRTAWLMPAGTDRYWQHLSGEAIFVLGDSEIIPVFCANPGDGKIANIDPRLLYMQRQKAISQAQQHLVDEQRATLNLCKTIFSSILLSEDAPSALGPVIVAPAAQSAKPAPASLAQTEQPVPAETGESLGTAARKLSQGKNSGEKPKIVMESAGEMNKAPAGFKVHSFEYCNGRYDCHDASVFVPTQAQQASSIGGQYEFQYTVGKDTAWFFVGIIGAGSSGSADYMRWLELQTDDGNSMPGAKLVSKYESTIDGKPAMMARFILKRTAGVVMGERGVVTAADGHQILVACELNQERFAELEPVCDTVIQSLHLPGSNENENPE